MPSSIRALLPSALVLLAPIAATGQDTSHFSGRAVAVAAFAGHTTVYQGGATYLVSASLFRPTRIAVEVAFEYIPTPNVGRAKILWFGLRSPRGTSAHAFYAGARGGFLDGPSSNGLLVDLHIGLQVGWKSFGIHLEPALLGIPDETLSAGGRVTAGVSWTFR